MSKTRNNEQIDADILQCKADIRSARGITPPSKKKPHQTQKVQKTGEKTTQPADAVEISAEKKAHEDTVPIPIETIAAPKKPTGLPAEKAKQEKSEIPRFDLAEEIMAEQRKNTAIRRKAPDKKVQVEEPQVESAGYIREQPTPEPSEQQVIAEIVARDIEKLCSGDSSADSK